jgi:hypothetical protein
LTIGALHHPMVNVSEPLHTGAGLASARCKERWRDRELIKRPRAPLGATWN